jgi:hypothetical protein
VNHLVQLLERVSFSYSFLVIVVTTSALVVGTILNCTGLYRVQLFKPVIILVEALCCAACYPDSVVVN